MCQIWFSQKARNCRVSIQTIYGKSDEKLCFPVLLFLQNFLAAYVLNCFPAFKNSLTFMRNIYVDFYKKLDTNLTRSNSISIFNKASTIWLICSAYFAYTLPMILVFIFILFFDPKTSLCWSYRSTFLLNNERKG